MAEPWTLLAALAKLGLYLGVLNAVGAVLVAAAFARNLPLADLRGRALVWTGVAAVCAAAVLVLRAAELNGSFRGVWDVEMLALLWNTAAGDALALRLVGLGIMGLGLAMSATGPWVALVGGAIVLFSFARVGHVSELDGMRVSVLLWLHLATAAFWIGILAPLIRLTSNPDRGAEAARVGERFGKIAMVTLPVLGLAGVVMAWLLVGSLKGLMTGYGFWLMLKLALVGALLWLGALNKLRHVPGLDAGVPDAEGRLRRSLRLEQAVAFLVLAATAGLTSFVALPS